jgi:hypothetical protein
MAAVLGVGVEGIAAGAVTIARSFPDSYPAGAMFALMRVGGTRVGAP